MEDEQTTSKTTLLTRMGQYAAYLVARLLVCVAQAVPLDICDRIAWLLAWLFWDVLRLRRRVIEENLEHAFADQSPRERHLLARRMWHHLFLFAAEVAHTPRKIHETNWRNHVHLVGGDFLTEYLLGSRPFVMVTGHLGNFELGGYVMGLLGYPQTFVARPLDNPYLDAWVYGTRTRFRQRYLSKNGDYEKILDVLGSGQSVLFLADQYAGIKGCWVDFGSPSAHKAIALLSMQFDAPIICGYCVRTGKPLDFKFAYENMIDPRDGRPETRGVMPLTQWYTAQIEKSVRRAPEQYWWLHRRWKDHRPAHKRLRKAA